MNEIVHRLESYDLNRAKSCVFVAHENVRLNFRIYLNTIFLHNLPGLQPNCMIWPHQWDENTFLKD
jgi:hypothetical protein